MELLKDILKKDKSVLIDTKKSNTYLIKGVQIPNVKIDEENRIISLVANTYNYFDADSDVLLMGCAKKSIQERGINSISIGKIKHLFNHKWGEIIGIPKSISESYYEYEGKTYTGIVADSYISQAENDHLTKYKEGIYDNHSIGYRYLELEWIDSESEGWNQLLDSLINPEDADKEGYAYVVKEIMLYEYSTVAFGANEMTPVLGVKGCDKENGLKYLLSELDKLEIKQKDLSNPQLLWENSMRIKQIKQSLNDILNQGPDYKTTLSRTQKEPLKKTGISENELNQLLKM